MKLRNQQEWLKEFDKTILKCKWFIIKYFGTGKYNEILKLRKEIKIRKLIIELGLIWFKLPNLFNIKNKNVMGKGWKDFLHLIELDSQEEKEKIIKGEEDKEIIIYVVHCIRCGEDHEKIKFTILSNSPRGTSHWAMCPIKNEPILMNQF